MTATEVEVQVGSAPQLDVEIQFDTTQIDVEVQIEPPTFTVVSVLPTGPRGPAGPAGATGAGSYVHDQVAASVTWTVVHGLAMFPNVTTVDTAGTVINGGVQYDSNNQLTVTFTTAQSGKAFAS